MEKKLTCIICPLGCELTVEIENGKIFDVNGNTCKRGEMYAKTECVNPQRTVTTTVRCEDGGLVSVKTEHPIPKDCVMACMEIINTVVVPLPISIGDVVFDDVFGTKIIATQNRKRKIAK